MKTYHVSVVIERDQDGYFVSCPDLQGCYSQGDTYEQAIENIKDAIKLHLEDRLDEKEELLPPKSVGLAIVEVAL
jgi:predicted RNase H-like HicB family nuclease